MKVYVTGHHRAGTHALARHLSNQTGLQYIDEMSIGMCDWNMVPDLDKGHPYGYVLQCPMISHRALHLAQSGDVYWCVRDLYNVVASQRGVQTRQFAWSMMRFYYNEFTDDPIWRNLYYNDGRDDRYREWAGYYTLLYKVKEYFFEKYFEGVVNRVTAETQPYWNESETYAYNHPLKALDEDHVDKHVQIFEVVYESIAVL